ncbi:MAG: SUMF1/EgtB/PvdO family nonheme iron enzyme [Acidobacteriota bacterium]|nr:MAG: SUMF1/EgtB/PvdO family nonheme iron enzyme [Acidobacteriota bacterium]
MSDLIGKIVCGYRILRVIGEGGMGKVYLAESAFLTEYKQQVAIKTLTTYASSQRQSDLLRDLFVREANIQVQFKHSHIVGVIQFAVEGDEQFLILEYMPGYDFRGRRISNVADVISHQSGPIPYRRALKWFIQALDAMHYAHNFRYRWEGEERVGIVHRDIKPANLLLFDTETIKVSDFGIVKVQQRKGTVTKQLTPGTSAYMAPEAILGPRNYGMPELDERSDIYSLGVTLFEMLAGRLPFRPDPDANPDVSLRRKHVNEQPPAPSSFYPNIPPEVDQLVLKALAKRPEERYQSAAEFKAAIHDLNATLELGLRDADTLNLLTNPLDVPTERMYGSTTAAGAGASTAAGRVFDPNATNLMSSQVRTVPRDTALPVEKPASSKMPLVLALLVFIIAGGVGGYFLLNRDKGEAAGIELTGATAGTTTETKPPATPAGMALIPEGSYMMGRDLTEEEKAFTVEEVGRKIKVFTYDYPAHEVSVRGFYLDETEVSNRQYSEFVTATGRPAPEHWNGPTPPANSENMPVTHVTYQDAVDYCNWRTTARNDGITYRLPTEEEWEYAARGANAGKQGSQLNLYPWGDAWEPGRANTKASRLERPQNVDSNRSGASSFGILNLSGNVYEWTATDFKHYPGSDQETPREKGYEGTYQVVRGGSFDYAKEYAMTTTRVWARPTNMGPRLGFRCAGDAAR